MQRTARLRKLYCRQGEEGGGVQCQWVSSFVHIQKRSHTYLARCFAVSFFCILSPISFDLFSLFILQASVIPLVCFPLLATRFSLIFSFHTSHGRPENHMSLAYNLVPGLSFSFSLSLSVSLSPSLYLSICVHWYVLGR